MWGIFISALKFGMKIASFLSSATGIRFWIRLLSKNVKTIKIMYEWYETFKRYFFDFVGVNTQKLFNTIENLLRDMLENNKVFQSYENASKKYKDFMNSPNVKMAGIVFNNVSNPLKMAVELTDIFHDEKERKAKAAWREGVRLRKEEAYFRRIQKEVNRAIKQEQMVKKQAEKIANQRNQQVKRALIDARKMRRLNREAEKEYGKNTRKSNKKMLKFQAIYEEKERLSAVHNNLVKFLDNQEILQGLTEGVAPVKVKNANDNIIDYVPTPLPPRQTPPRKPIKPKDNTCFFVDSDWISIICWEPEKNNPDWGYMRVTTKTNGKEYRSMTLRPFPIINAAKNAKRIKAVKGRDGRYYNGGAGNFLWDYAKSRGFDRVLY